MLGVIKVFEAFVGMAVAFRDEGNAKAPHAMRDLGAFVPSVAKGRSRSDQAFGTTQRHRPAAAVQASVSAQGAFPAVAWHSARSTAQAWRCIR